MDLDQFDYTFYAVFTRHEFQITFLAGTEDTGYRTIETMGIPFGDPLRVPEALPAIDESGLALDMRYKFLGYTQNKNNVIAASANKADIRNVPNMLATQDYVFYAVFVEDSVYNSVTDLKYFDIVFSTYDDLYDPSYNFSEAGTAYSIVVKPGVKVSGKITLPTYYNGLPVIKVDRDGFSNQEGVTHIFFYKEPGLESKFRSFGGYAFSGCSNLQYCEFPESLREISGSAFARCPRLVCSGVGNKVAFIGDNVFNQSLAAPKGQASIEFSIGGTVKAFKTSALSNNTVQIDAVYIGDRDNPSQLEDVGMPAIRQNDGSEVKSITIYCAANRFDFFSNLTASTGTMGHFQIADVNNYQIVTV
jgi:hypothetical protein